MVFAEPPALESKTDYKTCKILSSKISHIKDLPQECFDYKDIVASLSRRPTKSDSSIAFEGMGNAGAAAKSARQSGKENNAQIQRRYTNTRRFTNKK